MRIVLDEIRQKSAHIFEKIHEHPFVQNIHQATLLPSQFEYYSEQDDLYLEEWAEIILGLVMRLKTHPLSEDPIFMDDLKFIQGHLNNVKEMIYIGVFNPKRTEGSFVRAGKSQLIESYLSHLRGASQSGSFAVGLASLFGCYDLYCQIGLYSKAQQLGDSHPYRTWLSANYDEEFVATAERIFKLTQRIAEFELITEVLSGLTPVVDAACQSYTYEWEFFMEVMQDTPTVKSYLS